MSVGINGEIKTVYNVGKLKEAHFPVDKVRGAQRPNGKQAADTVPHPDDSVKQENQKSLRDTDIDGVSIREYLGAMQPSVRMTETEKLLLKKYQENLKADVSYLMVVFIVKGTPQI